MKVSEDVRHRKRRLAISVLLALAAPSLGDPSADAAVTLRPGPTQRVSVGMDGAEANNRSEFSSVSADGRYVAFHSFASNLVPGDTIFPDVFVEDLVTGTIIRASEPPAGAPTSVSFYPSLSADGRYVAFTSSASLVPTDTNGVWDIFVRDLESGAMKQVSTATDGTQSNGHSSFPSMSADGRYVAFHSPATNLVAGDTNAQHDVFVGDLEAGTLERISIGTDGSEGNDDSMYPSISADGRYVAFQSLASNFALPDLNRNLDVFVHDRMTRTTRRATIGMNGIEPDGGAFNAVMSPDGHFVAFDSSATNLVPDDSNGVTDVFLRDLTEGTIERISVGSDGAQADGRSVMGRPASSVSADGRYVVFHSLASDLVPGDMNGKWDVFVRDRATGTTHLASLASEGAQGNGDSTFASITADGRGVVFHSSASDLVPADHNGRDDVFVRDWGRSSAIGGLSAAAEQGRIKVGGWATFPGQIVASADDPRSDGHSIAAPAGGEIVDARLVYRDDLDDLLFRLHLATLPRAIAGSGVAYRVHFEADGVAYEIRGARVAAQPPRLTDASFTLWRCDGNCRTVASLNGAIGSSGPVVEVSVPMSILGTRGGTRLHNIEATTSCVSDLQVAPLLDTVALGDAILPTKRVELGVTAMDVDPGAVVYTSEADLSNGRFMGTLDTTMLAGGTYRVWARAALVGDEAVSSIEFLVDPGRRLTNLELHVGGKGNEMTLEARLSDRDDSTLGIEGRTIEFYSDNELIGSAQTVQSGVATLPVPPGHRGANRSYEALFRGDYFYVASSGSRSRLEGDQPRAPE